MADSVKHKIRDAVAYNLQQIDGTGSYNTKIQQVFTFPVSIEQMSMFPAVRIIEGNETYMNTIKGDNPVGQLVKNYDLSLDVWLKNTTGWLNIADEIDKVQADIERRLLTYYYLPDSTGAHTCFQLMFLDAAPFGMGENDPRCGVLIRIRVYYSQSMTDPTALM